MPGDPNNALGGKTDGGLPADLPDILLAIFWKTTNDYACALTDPQGILVGWRGAANDIYGYSESEVVGQPIDLIFTEDDRRLGIPEFERVVAAANGRSEDDRWHLRKDGARIWVSGALVALRENDSVIGYAKVMRDRTDLKSDLEGLRSRNEYLEQALTTRDLSLAKITHEIRNSLSPIKNAVRLLSMPMEGDHTKLAHAILNRQLALIESMARDLTEVAHISTGKFHLKKGPLDIATELVEIVNVKRADAAAKQQEMQVFVPDGPVIVNADRQRFHQIIFNLLDNAIKYTGESGHIWVKCIVETESALIKIEDDGIGISASMLPVIFDLFTREADDLTGGMGVGLALVKTLVEAHDGRMEVRSEGKGKGSEFAVRLPLLSSG
jgi:PAS domain S-box-containing protein